MATLTTALTYDNTTVGNFKQWTSGISNAILTLGWLSTGDAGALSATNNFGTATITNISASAGVVTITYSGATNNFAVNQKVLLTGLTTNTVFNNTYQVITTLPNTTTFTFNSTATVTNGAETGTVTITYGYATLTNVPDQVFTTNGAFGNNFPQGGQIRFRGSYVAATPTFTNLQTTNNLTTITVGTPHGLDSVRAIGQALNVSAVANANFTFLNTNPGTAASGLNGWPITAITQLTITINTGSSPRADIASTAVSAGIGTPQYQCTAANNVNPEFDTCTYQGDMYAITINSGLTNFNGTPGNTPTSNPGFKRFGFDMFKSNDSLSSTNPLYFKILFGSNNTAASGTATPAPAFYFGCASDGQGNITTNYNYPASGSVPFSPTSGQSANTGTAQWESNFSGTSGRLSFILWRGFTGGTSFQAAPTTILIIDRSKDNSGNDTDAYWTFLSSGRSNSSTGGDFQQSILKPGTGGAGIIEFIDNSAVTLSSIRTINIVGGQVGYNNQLPVLPIFPVIGFVGNPILGGISMKNGDTSEGALVSATFYGSSHTYLMTIRGGAQTFTPNGSGAAGIRWE